MNPIFLEVDNIKKAFSRRVIFEGISINISGGSVFCVTGKNGSGKTTLVKIISGILSPTFGVVNLSLDNRQVKREDYYLHIGFVAPYLTLYEEFSAFENLSFFLTIRGKQTDHSHIHQLLDRFSLYNRKSDPVRTFSSGMKQRLKYAFALIHRPEILILDEPRSNLDSEGIDRVYEIIDEQKSRGMVILATNDNEDLSHADTVLNLDELLKKK